MICVFKYKVTHQLSFDTLFASTLSRVTEVGYIEGEGYKTYFFQVFGLSGDLNDLQSRFRHEIDVLRHDPAMVRRAVQDMQRRSQLCVDRGGGHVEGVGP